MPLHRGGEYPNRYQPGTLRIPNIVLEDVRPIEGDLLSALQLQDPVTKLRRGEPYKSDAFHPHEFLICVPSEIGVPLFEHKEKWLNQRVNVFVQMQDVGPTVFIYTGYVTRIELLDRAGKVVDSLQSKT